MAAYYNEIDPFCVAWLRELIKGKLIADGEVDSRSIAVVQPDDLRGFDQCHFFAGIGGWSYALRLAGWPDDRPVWTGSCPCQPFSAAGRQAAHTDARHLWPEWFRLIRECHPHVIFGEQVEAAIRWGWLDAVSADLEREGYAIGAAVLGAQSVGAPHKRQRLWWVAESDVQHDHRRRHAGPGRRAESANGGDPLDVADAEQRTAERHRYEMGSQAGSEPAETHQRQRLRAHARDGESTLDVADTERHGCGQGHPHDRGSRAGISAEGIRRGPADARCNVADTDATGSQGRWRAVLRERAGERPARPSGAWSDVEWLACRDGKSRPTQPGLRPLADGLPGRVGRLRGYGNAIVPACASAFIEAYLDVHHRQED